MSQPWLIARIVQMAVILKILWTFSINQLKRRITMYKDEKQNIFMNGHDIGTKVQFTVGKNNVRSGTIISINGKRSDTCPVRYVMVEDDALTYQNFHGTHKKVTWDVKASDLIFNETGEL
jgi:hypothetical protein